MNGLPVLQGLKVVEVAFDVAGEMLGKLLAEYGAEVLKLESPEGSPTRMLGPFAGDQESVDSSLTYWFYNTNKRSAVAEFDDGLSAFHRHLNHADVLILSGSVSELRALQVAVDELADKYPRLVICALTPFGLDGPWAEFVASDLVSLAAAGTLNSCGYSDHSIPPIRPPENQSFHAAAVLALTSLFVALNEREDSGEGQIIDLAIHDSLAVTLEIANPYWFYPRAVCQRWTCAPTSPMPHQSPLHRTRDGRYVLTTFSIADAKPWNNLVEWLDALGIAADLTDPEFDDPVHRQQHMGHIQEILEVLFSILDADTIYAEGAARGLPVAVINSPDEVLQDEHLLARGFFHSITHDHVGAVTYPGSPFRMSAFPPTQAQAAPDLGEASLDEIWADRHDSVMP